MNREVQKYLVYFLALTLAIWPAFAWPLTGWGLFWSAVTAGSVLLAKYILFVIAYLLAKRNIIWTTVDEGRMKDVLNSDGSYDRTILSKKGHKVACKGEKRADGTMADDNDIIPLGPGEEAEEQTLHYVGIPPYKRVYERDLDYKTALPSEGGGGRVVARHHKDVDFTLAQRKLYGLTIPNAEDEDNLPLTFEIGIWAEPMNSRKLNFNVTNFYETMVAKLTEPVQRLARSIKYEHVEGSPESKEKLEKLKKGFGVRLMEVLRSPGSDGEASAFDELREAVGFHLHDVLIMNIDPPPEYRKETTRIYVATQTAKAEAEETSGALERILDRQIAQMEDELGPLNKEDKKEIRRECLNLLYRTQTGKLGQLRDYRFAQADGTAIAGGSIAELVAGVVAAAVAAKEGAVTTTVKNPPGSNPGGGPRKKEGGYTAADVKRLRTEKSPEEAASELLGDDDEDEDEEGEKK